MKKTETHDNIKDKIGYFYAESCREGHTELNIINRRSISVPEELTGVLTLQNPGKLSEKIVIAPEYR